MCYKNFTNAPTFMAGAIHFNSQPYPFNLLFMAFSLANEYVNMFHRENI